MENERHLGLRIEDTLLKKFHYVCAYDGRSINQKVNHLIRQCVAEYENSHGSISLSEETGRDEK